MRFVTFEHEGRTEAGAIAGDGAVVRLGEVWTGTAPEGPGMLAVIRAAPDLRDRLRAFVAAAPDAARVPFAEARLCPPVPRPGKILCLAGNYREHIVESGFAAVGERDIITPQMFLKPSTCLVGDEATVSLTPANVRVGWEAELALVIGTAARQVHRDDAMDHVFGYTILNDLTERALHSGLAGRRVRERDPFFDWLAGKWFDGFAPCGPWIVTADEIPDPHALGIRLTVNGELRQEGTTADMIFDVPALIAEASAVMTLEPGDLIATGTPAGAGTGRGKAVLQAGDRVVCEIERIGSLTTTIGAAA